MLPFFLFPLVILCLWFFCFLSSCSSPPLWYGLMGSWGSKLSAPKSQRFLRLRCPSRTPEIARFPRQAKAMLHCDLRLRWKVASDLRFRAAISKPKTRSFCGISGDLAQSMRKSLAIAIVRFWCAKVQRLKLAWGVGCVKGGCLGLVVQRLKLGTGGFNLVPFFLFLFLFP